MPSRDSKPGVTGTSASTFDADVRERLLPGHPIRAGDYTLPTPMMQRTYAIVRELVWGAPDGDSILFVSADGQDTLRARHSGLVAGGVSQYLRDLGQYTPERAPNDFAYAAAYIGSGVARPFETA